jgi:xylan 1,4-beta-xylosidase
VDSQARLVLRLDDAHWAAVERHDSQIIVRAVVGPFDQQLGSAAAPSRPATLAIRSRQPEQGPPHWPTVADDLELGLIEDGELHVLAKIDGRYLSTEVAGGFTGRVIGVEPMPDQTGPAIVRHFSYRGL